MVLAPSKLACISSHFLQHLLRHLVDAVPEVLSHRQDSYFCVTSHNLRKRLPFTLHSRQGFRALIDHQGEDAFSPHALGFEVLPQDRAAEELDGCLEVAGGTPHETRPHAHPRSSCQEDEEGFALELSYDALVIQREAPHAVQDVLEVCGHGEVPNGARNHYAVRCEDCLLKLYKVRLIPVIVVIAIQGEVRQRELRKVHDLHCGADLCCALSKRVRQGCRVTRLVGSCDEDEDAHRGMVADG